MAYEESNIPQLYAYRFEAGESLAGHALGNLLLTALTDITGGFDHAVLAAAEVLNIRGEIYPSTLADVRLRAALADDTELVGEVAISGSFLGEKASTKRKHARVKRLSLEPPDAMPTDRALNALREADLILIGPRSLYTSVIPTLLIKPIAVPLLRS